MSQSLMEAQTTWNILGIQDVCVVQSIQNMESEYLIPVMMRMVDVIPCVWIKQGGSD